MKPVGFAEGLLLGLIAGGSLGVLMAALAAAAGRGDTLLERQIIRRHLLDQVLDAEAAAQSGRATEDGNYLAERAQG